MKREFKFRLWDGKKMIRHDEIVAKFFIELDGTVWENVGSYEHDLLRERPNTEVMQFTGLKDKNGVEIYESDRLIDTLTKMEYVVMFGFCKKYGFTGWYVENEENDYVSSLNGDYGTGENSQVEIIGNKYESR